MAAARPAQCFAAATTLCSFAVLHPCGRDSRETARHATTARPFALQVVLQTQASIAVRRGGGPLPLGATPGSLPGTRPSEPLTPSHESEQTLEHEVSPAAAEVVESPSPTKRPSPGPSVFLPNNPFRAHACVGVSVRAHLSARI